MAITIPGQTAAPRPAAAAPAQAANPYTPSQSNSMATQAQPQAQTLGQIDAARAAQAGQSMGMPAMTGAAAPRTQSASQQSMPANTVRPMTQSQSMSARPGTPGQMGPRPANATPSNLGTRTNPIPLPGTKPGMSNTGSFYARDSGAGSRVGPAPGMQQALVSPQQRREMEFSQKIETMAQNVFSGIPAYQQLQSLQSQVSQNQGGQPTPEQMQRLQTLNQQFQSDPAVQQVVQRIQSEAQRFQSRMGNQPMAPSPAQLQQAQSQQPATLRELDAARAQQMQFNAMNRG